MTTCHYCGRDCEFPCRNTRDLTDLAIDGDETCFERLAELGWGEQGERYVRANKAALAARRAKGPPVSGPAS